MLEQIKALTIHNPYAHLIVTPQGELPRTAIHKDVENRPWVTHWRGLLAIHAGTSLKWFNEDDWPVVPTATTQVPEMPFGAIVGVVQLVACYSIEQINAGVIPKRFDWLKWHQHCSGPNCLVFEEPFKLPRPVPCTGRQGFFYLPPEAAEAVRAQIGGVR